ncbi:MFS transporter [Acaricomes phytoseiuli]|nr:MFS transporter [Acaricomes phytoseiuli]MCW1249392.1 MFS transporter [Acaricomes phytoseiuli]
MTALQRTALIIAILASFVSILDGSVVNLALPAISQELGGGLSSQQWIVDGYLLTLGALILVAGSLSDLFGRLRILSAGLIGFAITSVLCGLATSELFLILARILQGIAGALLVPSSLALIIENFRKEQQGRAIGQWTAWTGVATIAAPVLGGLAVDYLSWRFIFFVNLLPILVCWLLLRRLRALEGQQEPVVRESGRVDYLGAGLAVTGLGALVFGLIEQGSRGWGSPWVLGPLLLGAVALTGFIVHEWRAAQPMMPLSLFTVRHFWVGNLATFFIYGAMSLGFFTFGLFLQQVAGLPAAIAGLAMLPSTVLLLLLSSWFGTLAGRYGARWFMGLGPIVAGSGFLLLVNISLPLSYGLQVLPGMVVFGIGLAATVAPLTATILGSITTRRAGIGSAVNNAVSRVAGLIAIALAGGVLGGQLDLPGTRTVMLVSGLALAAGGVISLCGIRDRPSDQLRMPAKLRE